MQWHYECNGIMNKLNKHVLYIQLHLNLIHIKHVPGAGSTLVQVQAQCSWQVLSPSGFYQNFAPDQRKRTRPGPKVVLTAAEAQIIRA